MTTKTKTYPLRMPLSLKKSRRKLSKDDGTSINQFVVMAVAGKVSAINTAEYFAERSKRANLDVFDQIMSRKGGQPPAEDDLWVE